MFRNKEIKAVGLDVDSTLANFEGLNWLAERKGVGKEIEILTKESMDGRIPVSKVMPLKMDIICPSRKDMQDLSEEYIRKITPDAFAVIKELQRAGKKVFMITGNFHEAVDPLADALGIDRQDVFANNLEFNSGGSYKGYVENHHLMHDEGKQEVVKQLREKFRRVMHIGDSMGDASAGADVFIGYGGAALRESVLKVADNYIPNESIAPALAVALSRRQLRSVADKQLVERAQSGLLRRR